MNSGNLELPVDSSGTLPALTLGCLAKYDLADVLLTLAFSFKDVGGTVYCSKCGGSMPDGAAFCPSCGQAFSSPAAALRPPGMAVSPAPLATSTLPVYHVPATLPGVAYAGFWLRFLALMIDNVVLGLGFILVLIPLLFLVGGRAFFHNFHPWEDANDMSVFVLVGFFFLLATGTLVLTWLYHALMECSDWQATLGKKALGLVVTGIDGQRVSFGRASGRHFGKILTNMIPALLGYIMAAFTDRKQALHDMLAGCLVLRRIL